MRLDQYLVENNLVESRNKAQELIKNEKVFVNSKAITKPSFDVVNQIVEVESAQLYVSRSALKLKAFLAHLPFKAEGLNALDIGASTGGFSEVLLEEGVQSVTCVDVGHNQLHIKIKSDPKVKNFEGCDIRNFKSDEKFDLIVSDVSFISLHHILDDVERLSKKWIVLLFKPQFEVGREASRDKAGVIKDDKIITKAMLKFEDACMVKGWKLIRKEQAAIKGKEGNIEYCYCYERD